MVGQPKMMKFVDEDIADYIIAKSNRQTQEQKDLDLATLEHPRSKMLGSLDALQLCSNIIQMIGGKKKIKRDEIFIANPNGRKSCVGQCNLYPCLGWSDANGDGVLDVGVFTGASSLAWGLAIPEDGKVYALDITDENIGIGRPFWKKAGIEKKVNLILGPAIESLNTLLEHGHRDTFDFAFIDADKINTTRYYDACLKLIRKGGFIGVDNTIWYGRVLDEADQSENTKCIREFNDSLLEDQRINLSFLPVGDGLTLCFKK